MIANSARYVGYAGHTPLRQTPIMDPVAQPLTIVRINLFSTQIVIETVEDVSPKSYVPGMHIEVSGTSGGLNGTFDIHSIDYSGKEITCNVAPGKYYHLPSVGGTALPAGVCPILPYVNPKERVLNNTGHVLACRYDTAGDYLIDTSHTNQENINVQVTNHGAGAITVGFKYSLDRVTWTDSVVGGTIAAGKTKIYSTEILETGGLESLIKRNMYIRLTVNENVLHSVCMR